MPHLNAAGDLELAAARRAGVAWLNIADVDGLWVGEVAPPIHAPVVHVFFVGAAHEIGQARGGMIHVDSALKTDRADETRLRTSGSPYPIRARHVQRACHAVQLLRLDGVQL